MDEIRKDEHERVRTHAERFIEPLQPLFEAWEMYFEPKGIVLKHDLQVGPFPARAVQSPIRAVLRVWLKGAGVRSGGTFYFLDAYTQHEQAWLAAEIEYQIEEHLEDPAFGSLWEGVHDLAFTLTTYDRVGDHEHCHCCADTLASELQNEDGNFPASDAYVAWYPADPPYELWLCPRCFDYWSSRRNLIAL